MTNQKLFTAYKKANEKTIIVKTYAYGEFLLSVKEAQSLVLSLVGAINEAILEGNE